MMATLLTESMRFSDLREVDSVASSLPAARLAVAINGCYPGR